MVYKILIVLIFSCLSAVVLSQDTGDDPPLSPVAAALEQARQDVRDGNNPAAIAGLQSLFDSGFTAVGVVTGDEQLATLAGIPEFDALVAAMTAQAYPCEHDERFRAFDFWVGEWDVNLANGTLAGHNTISAAQRGCVLIENWTSARGAGGMSINYFDEANDEWVQVWNDASGNQIHIRGGMTGDGMLLSGIIHYVASDTRADFRGLWTPLPDGRVRQFFEQSNDDGDTWSPWFEGYYSRSGAAE